MSFYFRIGESEEERRAAYGLRKRVFGDELGDDRFIVDGHYFIDPFDKPGVVLLNAFTQADATMVATSRMYPRSLGPYIYDDLYFSAKLLRKCQTDPEDVARNAVVFSWDCVDFHFRKQGIFKGMIQERVRLAEENGSRYLLACIETWNNVSWETYEQLGFERYQTGETRPGFSYHWLCKIVNRR